ncbi:Peptidase M1 domain containing protein [Trichostrongylus colubriformis]|uniref:Peptidase M1 domain containing protein n=1 Tax=Trichostrongylus colubriformis TaxID=6319 RepID=A0AAN8INR3_TRICO
MKVYLPSYPDVPPEKELTFDGEVDILVEVLAPTNLIILHMLDIAIKNVHVLMNGENIFVKHKSSERLEVGVFLLRSTIPADEHIRVKEGHRACTAHCTIGMTTLNYDDCWRFHWLEGEQMVHGESR